MSIRIQKDILSKKADSNKFAADLLAANNFFAPAIHCYYYSCLQKLKSILRSVRGVTYEQLELEVRKKTDSHNYIISEVRKHLGESIRFKDKKVSLMQAMRNIFDLKNARKDADYQNIEITEDDIKKAKKICHEVHLKLSEHCIYDE